MTSQGSGCAYCCQVAILLSHPSLESPEIVSRSQMQTVLLPRPSSAWHRRLVAAVVSIGSTGRDARVVGSCGGGPSD